ncbi:uncharacterized SAM-binding protein YcdF (DUF218 family) [Nocardia transvalensis]|uniref:Uncharacterized SAM-binding protein YcdF (DUF218 family) n=1 Tax=Nocardia transvalensis TaxID=37333 RepID=A0A7W9PBC9_9NOCA|nr:YdcF family protein [Nocardia transvalensis]MBB5912939.1 uncharacterized SAM-binding protein YcdF (DUF218 family) [Nocardia transvalensis]
MPPTALPDGLRADVEVLWEFNQMHHAVRRVDVVIGLGSHDLGVATYAAELYHQGISPLIVFSGANAPTTVDRFPNGEAQHYRDHAVGLGVPDRAILVESEATNTRENIEFSRDLLDRCDRLGSIKSVMLISRPYQQRRSYATCRKWWPEVDLVCGSLPLPLDAYLDSIGDVRRVIDMLVGDTQRIRLYGHKGWAIVQDVPVQVWNACTRLVAAGFTSRLVPGTDMRDQSSISGM